MKSIAHRPRPLFAMLIAIAVLSYLPLSALSQEPPGHGNIERPETGETQPTEDENLNEEAAAEEEEAGTADGATGEEAGRRDESPVPQLEEVLGGFEGGEAGTEEKRWEVKINAAVRANYVFNESPDSFVIKYTFEVKGDANAETAVIRGDANITADVEGFIAKWPTGQCDLNISIPKTPFEITFRKSGEEKGSVSLQFRKPIMEDWKSSCSFMDAPSAKFDTSGPPEKWLAVAIEKARPPIRSIVTDIKNEETTTSFVIPKQTIEDAPLGTVEIEGTGVVTITPGG